MLPLITPVLLCPSWTKLRFKCKKRKHRSPFHSERPKKTSHNVFSLFGASKKRSFFISSWIQYYTSSKIRELDSIWIFLIDKNAIEKVLNMKLTHAVLIKPQAVSDTQTLCSLTVHKYVPNGAAWVSRLSDVEKPRTATYRCLITLSHLTGPHNTSCLRRYLRHPTLPEGQNSLENHKLLQDDPPV